MSEGGKQIEVKVGDIVMAEDHAAIPAVIVSVEPMVTGDYIMETEDGEAYVAPGGSFTGALRKLGEMSVDKVVEGLGRYYQINNLNFDDDAAQTIKARLEEQQQKGSVLRPEY